MSESADPFEQYRRKKLQERKRARGKKSHGEVAGDLNPDESLDPDLEPGTGERYAERKPKGFESTKYPDVPETKNYEKPKGFETHTYQPKKRK